MAVSRIAPPRWSIDLADIGRPFDRPDHRLRESALDFGVVLQAYKAAFHALRDAAVATRPGDVDAFDRAGGALDAVVTGWAARGPQPGRTAVRESSGWRYSSRVKPPAWARSL